MSMQNQGKDAAGDKAEQVTRDAAGMPGQAQQQGSQQSAGQGSHSGEAGGNRQAGQQGGLNQQGSGGMRTTETDRDQGSSARE